MERTALLEGSLASVSLDTLQDLVAQIGASSRVTLPRPPVTALVMMPSRDFVQWPSFYLGEVLVSHCAAAVDGTVGFGCVLGGDPDRAYCLAVIDAAVASHHPLRGAIAEARRRAEARQTGM